MPGTGEREKTRERVFFFSLNVVTGYVPVLIFLHILEANRRLQIYGEQTTTSGEARKICSLRRKSQNERESQFEENSFSNAGRDAALLDATSGASRGKKKIPTVETTTNTRGDPQARLSFCESADSFHFFFTGCRSQERKLPRKICLKTGIDERVCSYEYIN